MQNIEDMVISNYQINMEYFKTNHLPLYNKLKALETILDEGKYPQKYELEYLDGYFDVVELQSNNRLYAQNSQFYSDKLSSDISFKKNEQVLETFYNYQFTKKAVEKLKNSDPLTMHATTAEIIDYHDSIISTDMSMNKIVKFIFLGVGLAMHLPKIVEKTKATVLLIIEDDIELFRLSLFTINYQDSLKGCHAYFSIAHNPTELSDIFTEFYVDAFVRNHYLKFSLFSAQYEPKIKELQTLILSRPEIGYSHEYLLYKNIKVLDKLKENYKFLDLSKKESEEFFSKKPILVLGAGPSLHKNSEWLVRNSNRFILVVVFAALKTLYKLNISPDIVIQVDEKVTETHNLINSFESFDFLKDALFIFSASVPDILFETFKRDKIYLLEDRTSYKLNNTLLVSASVGESAYAISLIFNASNIYILGLDLALGDDGATHAKDHHLGTTIDTSLADKLQSSASLEGTVIQIKGNFRDKVSTTPRFIISIPILNRFTKRLKAQKQNIYNLSDGAYFENTIPLRCSEYIETQELDKSSLNEDLRRLFDSYSSSTLSNEELNKLRDKALQVQEWYKLLDNFRNSASSNKYLFIEHYNRLLQAIFNSHHDELYELMAVYFLNSASYVADIFNTKELNNPKKHIKKIKRLVIIGIEKIMDMYEEELLKAINQSENILVQ